MGLGWWAHENASGTLRAGRCGQRVSSAESQCGHLAEGRPAVDGHAVGVRHPSGGDELIDDRRVVLDLEAEKRRPELGLRVGIGPVSKVT